MTSAEESRVRIWAARTAAADALRSLPGLATGWTKRPPSGEGEEAWSPRDVALHLVYGEWSLVDNIAQRLLAVRAPMTAEIDRAADEAAAFWARLKRDQQGGLSLSGPEETATILLALGQRLDPLLALFTDRHLGLVVERPTGPVTIESRLQYAAAHTLDHVDQLRSLV